MSVFLTGATGYLGSYVATGLLRSGPNLALDVLVRAPDREAAYRDWPTG